MPNFQFPKLLILHEIFSILHLSLELEPIKLREPSFFLRNEKF